MSHLIDRHRTFAKSAEAQSLAYRLRQLEALRQALLDHRETLLTALASDLRKPTLEAYASELAPVIHEIAFAKKNLKRWMRPQRIGRGRLLLPSPYGAALIIGTWNYPIQLTLVPLVSAIAAGNGVTVKPSEVAPATAEALRRLIESTFEPAAVAAVLGGPEVSSELIDGGYDKVFFTGSPRVGALVAERAAPHHSSVTLELGGKSPVIVGPDSDLRFAARRIAWGKCLNAGQTCMAPDYLLAPAAQADELVAEIQAAVRGFFGDDVASNPDFGRIINHRQFDRLAALLSQAAVPATMNRDDRFIAPTVVRCSEDSPLMTDELFGPILPVLTYDSFDELRAIVDRHRNPLAMYVFTRDPAFEQRVLTELDFGGGMVNDVVLHAVDPHLPFGGRGSSGTGRYHGRYGFETFSHVKGIARRRQGRAGSSRFPPYRDLPVFVRKLVFGI